VHTSCGMVSTMPAAMTVATTAAAIAINKQRKASHMMQSDTRGQRNRDVHWRSSELPPRKDPVGAPGGIVFERADDDDDDDDDDADDHDHYDGGSGGDDHDDGSGHARWPQA